MTFIYFYDFPFSWEWKIIPTDELTNSYIFQRGSSTINQDFIFVDTTSGGPAIDLTNLPENVRYVHRDNTGFLVSGGRVRCFRTVFPKENSLRLGNPFEGPMCGTDLGMGQNLVPLVNIKIAGKWMFIPLKMVSIGIDPYPSGFHSEANLRIRYVFLQNWPGLASSRAVQIRCADERLGARAILNCLGFPGALQTAFERGDSRGWNHCDLFTDEGLGQSYMDTLILYLVAHPTARKWVIIPVINGISWVNPLIIGVITHLLSGMSHQVVFWY